MAELTIKCVCGEQFEYNFNLAPFIDEFEKSGVIPLIIPHKGHFVTAYIDRQLKVRSVERVIMVDKDQQSTIVSTDQFNEEDILKIIERLKKESDPNKNYFKFVSSLLYEVQQPEALFIAGRKIGYEMWLKLRDPIIKLGATYQPKIDLLLKSELKPILDKAGTTKLLDDNELEVNECIAPQFVIGLAQGILVGIGEIAEEKMDIKIEYVVDDKNVKLVLK